MPSGKLSIRYSPFLFLKRLVIIQLLFAFLPFLTALLLSIFFGDIAAIYERLAFARSISFELLLTLASTSLQLLVLFAAFITWYIPVYVADREHIVHNRGSIMGSVYLVDTPAITKIKVEQGWLARRLGYGSLVIETPLKSKSARLRDIPDPQRHMNLIWDLVEPVSLRNDAQSAATPLDLITSGEGRHVEFKSSLLWDHRQQRVNKELYLPVLKNTAAFMNTSGGFVVIGVDDDGVILGLDADFQALNKGNPDGFESVFNNAFNKMIGVEYRHFVDIAFPTVEQKTICVLQIQPSDQPVFLVDKGEERFYIRAGNASQPLSISQAARYIGRRYEMTTPASS